MEKPIDRGFDDCLSDRFWNQAREFRQSLLDAIPCESFFKAEFGPSQIREQLQGLMAGENAA